MDETEAHGKGATVDFDAVTKRYGDLTAVDGFSLSVIPGEFVTFLGPSGSGKTTVLNMLAGFVDVTAGDIRIDGRSVTDIPTEKRNVGMVFQHYSLFPHMKVIDNVAFPLRMRGVNRTEARSRAKAALEMVRLDGLAGRMPQQLSGGQKQRVALARAVVFEPPVLLMDEPLGALDLKLREAMQLELRQFHETVGCTIIFVTHDQTEALTLSDRIVVMRDGQIEQVDGPAAIYDAPKSRFVADFVGQTNLLALEPAAHGAGHIPGFSGNVLLPENVQTQAGDAWCVSLRPEKLQRASSDDDFPIRGEVEVDEILFLGNEIQYSVRSNAGLRLMMREQRSHLSSPLAKGDRITLGFRAEDAIPVIDNTPATR